MDAYNRYAELEEQEDLSAPEKATEYARWLDGQKYTQKQKKLLGESLRFILIYLQRRDSMQK